jgi:diguanylate cyclase (GGDEF)-like protein
MWQQHRRKLLFSLLLLSCSTLLALQLGDLKPWQQIDPVDALGEGITLLVCSAWLWLILSSRPAGRVTERLYYGSLLLVYCYFLDVADEFIRYQPDSVLMTWLESFAAPVGMVLLTIGLIGWHHEQRAIDRQLRGRELFLRDHQLLDPLTQLYGPDYLHAVLSREIGLQQPLALLVIDICQFSQFNRRFGVAAADELLCQLGEALASQLRFSDLVCRFRGDCFIAVLPATSLQQAEVLQQHITQQLSRFSLHQQAPALTVMALAVNATNADIALSQAKAALQAIKAQQMAAQQHAAPAERLPA